MIHLNLTALNPFRRSSQQEPSTKAAEAPKPETQKAEPKNLLDRSRDFFADTWESTKKTVDDVVDAGKDLVSTGAQKGREAVEETLWGEYKKDWGDYGDRYENPDDANTQRQSTATIEARISARSKPEAEALTTLTAVDQIRYLKLQSLIQADPLSKEALQTMLLDGRLPGDKALAGGGTLLQNLAALSEQTLAKGIERDSLVSDLIQEVENPVVINQKDKNTCVATSSVMDLALRNPAEFVRLVSGLAAPEGKVKLAGGSTITREAKWEESLGKRTQSTHMLSGALMELGNGLLAYDALEDKHMAFEKGLYEGLFVFGANKVLSELHDRKYQGLIVHRWNVDKVMTRMADDTSDGKRVPVGLAWGDGGHQVVVEGIKDGQVYFLNPHGNRERLPEAEFKERLRSVHFYG
jgi:hypothetical protein